MIWSCQRGYKWRKLCLTNVVAFCDGRAGFVDERRVVHVLYLGFSEIFSAVSCNIHTDKLTKCRLDKWTVRWTENWMNCWTQRAVLGTKSSWRSVTNKVPRGLIPGPVLCGAVRVHPQQVSRQCEVERSGWDQMYVLTFRGMSRRGSSSGPALVLEPHKIQQREMPSPVAGED